HPLRLANDLVIPVPPELDQTEPVTERIGQVGDVPPLVGLDLSFKLCARGFRPLHCRLNIRNDEVQVNWGPMASIITPLWHAGRSRTAGGLGQEVDRRRGAEHFGDALAQTASESQPQSTAIELDRFLKIIDVYVGKKLGYHGSSLPREFTPIMF